MKVRWVMAAAGLGLTGLMATAQAQPYGGGGYGYGGGGRDYEYRERRRAYEEDDYAPRRRSSGFDPSEYVRCNPDVRRALRNGQLTSAEDHYRVFGRREGRRLTC